jgi:hypothetical protein
VQATRRIGRKNRRWGAAQGHREAVAIVPTYGTRVEHQAWVLWCPRLRGISSWFNRYAEYFLENVKSKPFFYHMLHLLQHDEGLGQHDQWPGRITNGCISVLC